jgi:hypothetical protein
MTMTSSGFENVPSRVERQSRCVSRPALESLGTSRLVTRNDSGLGRDGLKQSAMNCRREKTAIEKEDSS